MEDLMQRLPQEVLDAVLRRLDTPRVLATSRCVCKTWRALIDARGLPVALSGIFTHPRGETLLDYFVLPHQPSSTQVPAAAFDTEEDDDPLRVVQHCNGLLLLGNGVRSWRVLNPATGQWARLPSPPPLRLLGVDDFYGYEEDPDYEEEDGFVVFDPATSPHYQVLLINSIPFMPWPDCQVVRPSTKEREWPPASYTLRVFSSETRLWEQKQFTRQGEARGTVQDMLWCPTPNHSYAAYWRGALYVHERDFAMRINLSDHTYQVISLPDDGDFEEFWTDWYLGKSNGGVYCAILFKGHSGFGLQVWFLDETCAQMKWALRRDVDLRSLLPNFPSEHGDGPSTTQCAHHGDDGDGMSNHVRRTLSILGFHPNKEVVFIHTPSRRVMAYQFDSSDAQDMGYLPVDEVHRHRIHSSFPYTPCRSGELSSNM
ncbi:hypothetical protein QYE76_019415 [Lolium multiflorum]|uniref:F-box domain-containing protein n=1 Tax=Lolium multiflorum TaxID=4521 RepID=A0AAD8R319_LOLMU|nr:hypothetical protein QYE76_019415 [Lolium multiflorum]